MTSEAVLGKVLFLLARMPRSRAAFEDLWLEGRVEVRFDVQAQKESLVALRRKYSDIPMSLADATVVSMSELFPGGVVWTLDSHFRIYRRWGRKAIPLVDWPRDRRT